MFKIIAIHKEFANFHKRNNAYACKNNNDPLIKRKWNNSKCGLQKWNECNGQDKCQKSKETKVKTAVVENVNCENAFGCFAVYAVNDLHKANDNENHCACNFIVKSVNGKNENNQDNKGLNNRLIKNACSNFSRKEIVF